MILVCVKPVPDVANLAVSQSQNRVFERGKRVLNPFDEHAIELARTGGKETAAVSIGIEEDVDVVRAALARGVDRGILVVHPDARAFDAAVLARLLAAVARKTGAESLACGLGWPKGALGQVTFRVAEELQWPCGPALAANSVARAEPKSAPKLPSAIAIMKAMKKEIQRIPAAELASDLTSYTTVKSMGLP